MDLGIAFKRMYRINYLIFLFISFMTVGITYNMIIRVNKYGFDYQYEEIITVIDEYGEHHFIEYKEADLLSELFLVGMMVLIILGLLYNLNIFYEVNKLIWVKEKGENEDED